MPNQNSKSSRLSVILLATAVAFSLLGDQAFYSILPVYFKELGLLPFQVGILLSANRWIRLITNHLAERLIQRYQLTRLLLFVFLLGVLLTIAYGTLPFFLVLLGARILWGFCWSILRQAGIRVSLHSSSTSNRGQLVGLFNGIYRIGAMAGSFLGAVSFDLFGYTATFLGFGCFSMLGIPLTWSIRDHLPTIKPENCQEQQPFKLSHHRLLLTYGFIIGLVGTGLIMSTLGFILKHKLGSSISINGLIIGITSLNGFMLALQHISNIIGAPSLGYLADWLGHRRTAFCFAALASLVLITAGLTNQIPLLLVMVLVFFICETVLRVAVEVKAGVSGAKPYAYYATAFDLGAAIGPLLAWALLSFVELPYLIFIIGGCLYMVTTFILFNDLPRKVNNVML